MRSLLLAAEQTAQHGLERPRAAWQIFLEEIRAKHDGQLPPDLGPRFAKCADKRERDFQLAVRQNRCKWEYGFFGILGN